MLIRILNNLTVTLSPIIATLFTHPTHLTDLACLSDFRNLKSEILTKTPQKAAKHRILSSTAPRLAPQNVAKIGLRCLKNGIFTSFLVKTCKLAIAQPGR